MRRFGILLCAVVLCGTTLAQESAPAYPVSRVIDGDTVVLLADGQEVKVRLIGVDTPETVHPQKPVEYYGREASVFLKNLLRGESVHIVYDGERIDKYGRTLAYLYRAPDGLFVNAEIVRQGYGHAYTRFPFKYMELFRAYEQKARESGKGLWSGSSALVTPPAGTGRTIRAEEAIEDIPEDVTVYLTRSGTKYHLEGCRYLKKSRIAVGLEEAKTKAAACKVCRPPK